MDAKTTPQGVLLRASSHDAIVGVATEVEVGIAPGVEFGRAAQGPAGTEGSGALLA